ncbi:GntR family transcriptional regulator [Paramixta manurensis]|uniref:GntR family transcriptional regulator n=1 Tax=Paramixta manurensis TaxID=2740817 RepID=A0A6M8U358_9GAMM|nr:GntR family transcriptional regulator [Erwiniaceae bacterium PD-1]
MGKQATTLKQREVQRIIDKLSKAIAQHRLRPGSRLVEAQIVEALNANRNHVQSALQRLAMQHIVTIEPNRGAIVAQPTATEAREIFIARRAIERAIIQQITPRHVAAWQAKIEAHLHHERQATCNTDRQLIVRRLSDFHLLLGEISGNRVLNEILANLMVRSSLIVSLYQRNDVPSCQSDEHQEIFAALAAGENLRAQEMMMAHLDELESQLALDTSLAPEASLHQILLET